jgi:uncharacterized ferritin-like protein (DUF455 family)
MKFHQVLHDAIRSDDIDEKARHIQDALAYCSQNDAVFEDYTPVSFQEPSYASRCRIVEPKALKNRKAFDTPEGLATLVHAIAHIEYSAVDLALDAAYRFYDMPLAFKVDWLEVADDEVRHFRMLDEVLRELGYAYGDFPVHMGLFDAAKQTENDVLERMAVIPRFYEATGLDVNPQIVKKLEKAARFEPVRKVLAALDIIYEEEIEHVRKGDKWFKYLCEQRGLSTYVYFDIIDRYNLRTDRPHINVEGRKEAGFSCDEILKMGASRCEE